MSAGFASLVRNAGWLASRLDGRDKPDGNLAASETAAQMSSWAEAAPCAIFQLLLEDRLREIEDPSALADAACALVAARLGACRAVLIEIHDAGQPGPVRGAWPPGSGPFDADVGLAALGEVLVARLAEGHCVQSSADLDPEARLKGATSSPPMAREAGHIAWMAASPVMAGDRLVAVMLAADTASRCLPEAELGLLRRAGERSWSAFCRARETATLRSSENELRLAIELCPQTFWATTPDGRLDDQGSIFGQFGARQDDEGELGWRRTTHPDDLPAMEQTLAQCLKTGGTCDIEHRILGEDGCPRWVHVHARPVRGPDGRVQRWLGTVTDIDRRKRAETALKASEDRFMRAISGARVGTWDWDMGTDEFFTSPGFAPQFHDLPEGSIRSSRDFLEAIHPDDRERMARILSEVVDRARRHGSAEYEAEYRVVRGDGEVRWLGAQGNVTLSPGDGHGGFLSGMTVDMSERRRAEEMLTAAQDRLHALNAGLEAQVRHEVEMREHTQSLLAQSRRMEALGQLAGGIAHDFNNVLQAVVGGLDLLQRRADRPQLVRQIAERTAEAAARGSAITGRLLAFARRSDLQTQEVEALPLLDGLRDLLRPTLGVGIALEVSATPDLPPLLVDHGQLETVLVNLAVNARDAMPEGGTLAIEAQAVDIVHGAVSQPELPPGLRNGRYIRLTVRDNGVGMSVETMSRASEPFFTTKPVGHGTGLGLAMARGFAEQSGGGLTISSTIGQGTTVSLWFPAVTKDAVGEQAEPQTRVAPHVLVVDDDRLVGSMLASIIEEMGCTIVYASRGEEAMAKLDAGGAVDLVVSDYAMPGMNGLALAANIRLARPNLPVLMVTGHADASLEAETSGEGSAVSMVLRKPVAAPALLEAISMLLAKGRIDS